MHKGFFIIFLRANMIEKNSSHILSFHRYIYIYSTQMFVMQIKGTFSKKLYEYGER